MRSGFGIPGLVGVTGFAELVLFVPDTEKDGVFQGFFEAGDVRGVAGSAGKLAAVERQFLGHLHAGGWNNATAVAMFEPDRAA